MMTKRELEAELKLTESDQAFQDAAKSSEEEQNSEAKPCVDLVNRADLINKLEIIDKRYGSDFYWSMRRLVDSVPPARKKGRWIKEYDNSALAGFYHCSICSRKLWIPKEESVADYPYCHCGADMRGNKE